MSWQASVIGVGPQFIPDGCCGVGGAFCSPLIAPVTGSANSRGMLTIAAFCGAASGTLITSMRQSDVSGFVGGAFRQPGSVDAGLTPAVPDT